jgi:hypothetical protein
VQNGEYSHVAGLANPQHWHVDSALKPAFRFCQCHILLLNVPLPISLSSPYQAEYEYDADRNKTSDSLSISKPTLSLSPHSRNTLTGTYIPSLASAPTCTPLRVSACTGKLPTLGPPLIGKVCLKTYQKIQPVAYADLRR